SPGADDGSRGQPWLSADGPGHGFRRGGPAAAGYRRHRRHPQFHFPHARAAAHALRVVGESAEFRDWRRSEDQGRTRMKEKAMNEWFWYAIGAAVPYG